MSGTNKQGSLGDNVMIIQKNTLILAVVILSMLILGACAGTELRKEPVVSSEKPSMQIENLESSIQNARKEKVNIYAPISFSKAESSLEEAKQGVKKGEDLSDIIDFVAIGRMQIQLATKEAELAKNVLRDTIDARQKARVAGATRFEKDYNEAEDLFMKLPRAVEKNDLDYAEKTSLKVSKAFNELELRAIKLDALGEARDLISQAEKRDAEDIAPESFSLAINKLMEADQFITSNRYDKNGISEKSDEATFYARRLNHIIDQSKAIKQMQPEQITLWIEEILHETANKLSMSDIRDKDFKTQLIDISGKISKLRSDYSNTLVKLDAREAEVKSMNQKIAALEGLTREEQIEKARLAEEEKAAKRSLEEERRLNQLYIEARREFGPTEAEVYKQGNSLVIRLKSIQFPVGTAIIMPSNYPVLKRVQDAVRAFGEPEIVIEGHTDSTGSDEVNKRLSQERASAVREYFIANGSFSSEQIYAVGYGSSRPLASNATAEGRAINRRIDVMITPDSL
jgi:outer membrane protein OmpA-like peptidoglycan-associated protein